MPMTGIKINRKLPTSMLPLFNAHFIIIIWNILVSDWLKVEYTLRLYHYLRNYLNDYSKIYFFPVVQAYNLRSSIAAKVAFLKISQS